MLEPDLRVILVDQLRPPFGYRLDAAVATTFTLDLAAALIPPLAFASFEIRHTPDPIAALEAVRSCADRVDLFCQTGQIRVPTQASDLMAFLEPMVHEVTAIQRGHLFHPKVWFLRYTSNNDVDAYRLLCSSRNLTADRSWDAIVRLDGQPTAQRLPQNRALAALIDYLPTRTINRLDATRRRRIHALADEAHYIKWDRPDDVNDIFMHLWGVDGETPVANFSGYRHLVVAPFCDDAGVRGLVEGSDHATLISRTEDLDRLQSTTLSLLDESLVLDSMAGVAEPDEIDEAAEPTLFTSLHAKMVVVERNRVGHVFIGSANATTAAFNGNVEFMVELVGGATRIGVESFLGTDSGLRSILVSYSTTGGAPPDPIDEALRVLQAVVRALAGYGFSLTVVGGDDGYDLHLATTRRVALPDGYTATAELLTRPGDAHPIIVRQTVSIDFRGISITDITPFVALRVSGPGKRTVGCVVRVRLIGDPAGRLDQILARQVDSPEKFLRFLALLLGLTDPTALFAAGGTSGKRESFRTSGPVGVLELVLRALSDDPRSLQDLDRLVQSLQASERGRQVLPPGFERLWTTVLGALARAESGPV